MPELPEVETVRRGLSSICLGLTPNYIKFYREDLRDPIPTEKVRSVLLGERITGIERRSKYLIFHTAKGQVLSHLGMTGNYITRNSCEPDLKHTHYVIGFEENKELFVHYVDPRRFGRLGVGSQEPHQWLSQLGPEPLQLSAEELGEHLFDSSRKKVVPVKTFLMNASVVVGVGNIYACEALFSSRISPQRKAGSISKARFLRLAANVQTILHRAIEAGGSTIKDFKSANGQAGYFAAEFNVYGRTGKPCVTCGKTLSLIKQTGRSTWFCRNCQT